MNMNFKLIALFLIHFSAVILMYVVYLFIAFKIKKLKNSPETLRSIHINDRVEALITIFYAGLTIISTYYMPKIIVGMQERIYEIDSSQIFISNVETTFYLTGGIFSIFLMAVLLKFTLHIFTKIDYRNELKVNSKKQVFSKKVSLIQINKFLYICIIVTSLISVFNILLLDTYIRVANSKIIVNTFWGLNEKSYQLEQIKNVSIKLERYQRRSVVYMNPSLV